MRDTAKKYGVELMFLVVSLMVVGYFDMRILAGQMKSTLDETAELARVTRQEQLLRTDEIDFVNNLRGHMQKDKMGLYVREK